MKNYPNVSSYVKYIKPNFRIVVGDFRTRSAAEKYRLEIEDDYPNAFIIKDNIKYEKF